MVEPTADKNRCFVPAKELVLRRLKLREFRTKITVTFSKRRKGLFKKSSELCILCSAETALIVFSPAGKVFSFVHPSVNSVINRYIDRSSAIQNNDAAIRELSRRLTKVNEKLEAEKKKGLMILDKVKKKKVLQFWWEEPIDKLDVNESKQLKVAIKELRKNAMKRADELMMEASSSSSFLTINPILLGVIPARLDERGSTSIIPHGFPLDFVVWDLIKKPSALLR
ncbi:hypothetical protein NE237_005113 [Protea cynaroides]|uniref:MADS-box domain-containing protein n=1 Tax=Protea cynaroides TaxID=273540 RepID=A0A9Q0QUB4_9MAGN|nr:hypothetical protein NE237_005113 [Protea cynaroides]